jgi:hypothetical protein
MDVAMDGKVQMRRYGFLSGGVTAFMVAHIGMSRIPRLENIKMLGHPHLSRISTNAAK